MNTQRSETNSFSMPLFVVILFITTSIFFSLKIYAWWSFEDTTSSNIEQYNSESNIIKKNSEINQEESTKEIIQKGENIQEENTTDSKVYTYTADNGNTYDIVGTIKIPIINIEYPILSTTSDELLKVSVTKYWGADPNKVGNMVVIGHNYKNDKFFGKLSSLNIGDNIQITDLNNTTLNYTVYDTDIIEDDDNSCTSQKTGGNIEITLITCYYEKGNSQATKRFVVKAKAN